MIDEAIEKLAILLQGKIPNKIEVGELSDKKDQQLADMLNQLIDVVQETHAFIVPLSNGILTGKTMSPKNFLASPFKELHSRLLHLTWQAKQVASGDFNQRVDFMGEFSEAFNAMIVALDHNETMLKKKIDELEQALSHIKKLEGILPLCSYCKKVRLAGADPGDQEGWVHIDHYISERTEALVSHSICPECMLKLYPDMDEWD
jgi:hypothetical protein